MPDQKNSPLNPAILSKVHRIMEWCNLIIVATTALGITAWFTAHYTLFYITGGIALVLTLFFMWGPVLLGIMKPGEGRVINGILFLVIGILLTSKVIDGIILGGCFFGLFGMLPLAWTLFKERWARRKGNDTKEKAELPVSDTDRDTRIGRMSEAFDRLSEVSEVLMDSAPDLEDLAPDVDLLKDYVSSGKWLEDFEADERGEIGPEVNRSVLSEDGLYNLMADLDSLMHCFERLTDRFAADPELEEKLQEME